MGGEETAGAVGGGDVSEGGGGGGGAGNGEGEKSAKKTRTSQVVCRRALLLL